MLLAPKVFQRFINQDDTAPFCFKFNVLVTHIVIQVPFSYAIGLSHGYITDILLLLLHADVSRVKGKVL